MNLICHCRDCSFHQGASQNSMFNEGSIKIVKGKEKVGTFNRTGTTLRARCTDCGVYLFARALQFGLMGTPYDHLKYISTANTLPDLGPIAFHVNYHSKRLVFRDGLTKFNDFPSAFGGSGDINNDEGNIIANDKDVKKDAPVEKSSSSIIMMNAASVSSVVTTSYNGLLQVTSIPKPTIRPGHAIVKVIAASVNPVDKMFARGWTASMGWPAPFPVVLGEDFAGIVEEV
jgi:hypothetical protein